MGRTVYGTRRTRLVAPAFPPYLLRPAVLPSSIYLPETAHYSPVLAFSFVYYKRIIVCLFSVPYAVSFAVSLACLYFMPSSGSICQNLFGLPLLSYIYLYSLFPDSNVSLVMGLLWRRLAEGGNRWTCAFLLLFSPASLCHGAGGHSCYLEGVTWAYSTLAVLLPALANGGRTNGGGRSAGCSQTAAPTTYRRARLEATTARPSCALLCRCAYACTRALPRACAHSPASYPAIRSFMVYAAIRYHYLRRCLLTVLCAG